ncbi:MAG: hypothetical protein HZB14_05325 [Actinobacteria bacterium]|nr:hypothetical protein [Actinomycetota bacterium]
MFDSFPPPPWPAEKDVWFNPNAIPEDFSSAQHVVVQGMPDPLDPFAEPEYEMVVATEDDFEDDCPLCQMMRDRIRNGERIEIMKVKWE